MKMRMKMRSNKGMRSRLVDYEREQKELYCRERERESVDRVMTKKNSIVLEWSPCGIRCASLVTKAD